MQHESCALQIIAAVASLRYKPETLDILMSAAFLGKFPVCADCRGILEGLFNTIEMGEKERGEPDPYNE